MMQCTGSKVKYNTLFFKGFNVYAGITFSILDKLDDFYDNSFNYFSIDDSIRYDFNLSKKNLVPCAGIGGSIVGTPSTIPSSKVITNLNFIFRGTFWISHQWGVNVQELYKYSQEEFESMRTHNQLSVVVVYSFRSRVMVYRLWDSNR